jgi:hypothetical protein
MNRRGGLIAVLLVAGLLGTAGCPDNPYEADTWIEKLDDPRELESAITKLEQLGDPKAIPALATAWEKQGRPTRILQVIIDLARPLSQEQADKLFTKPRGASWPLALPVLKKAVDEFDEANPRSVDAATKAAAALGEAKLKDGLQSLIDLVNKPASSKGAQVVQLTAIQALGGFTEDGKAEAGQALTTILRQDPAPTPSGGNEDERRAQQEAYVRQHALFAAAIVGLAGLRTEQSVPVLIETMYRMPALFSQVRRALVASGPSVGGEMRKILRGEHAQVNAVIKEKKLDKYCGERGELTGDQCKPTSLRDHYAAIILGDLYDPKSVPDLLAALERPAQPVSYSEGVPSPNTQHNGIYDALRKIGAPEAAGKLKSVWSGGGDTQSRALAASAYAFVARDAGAVGELGNIIEDPKTDANLRQEMLTTYARLAAKPDDVGLLQRLAKVNYDKYLEAKKKSEGKEKAAYDKAKGEIEKAKKANAEAKAKFIKAGGERKASSEIIAAMTETQKAVDAADEKYDEARGEWKPLDNERQAYLDFTRGLETHIARVEIALHCKADVECYGKSLSAKPDEIVGRLGKYVKTIDGWTDADKKALVPVQVERAMLELGKLGAKAEGQTEKMLEEAKTNDRLTRQSILLALPKVAKLPCTTCEAKLDAAIKAGEGAATLGDLNVETQMLRNYFSWAGK